MAKGRTACGREEGTGEERRGRGTEEGKNGVKTLLEGVVVLCLWFASVCT